MRSAGSEMRKLSWLGLGLVVMAALLVGVVDREDASAEARAARIAESVMCPTCDGQSVADSQAPAANNVRQEIARRVEAGQTDDEIREALAETFGRRIILNPPRSGAAGLVWVIPVAALVVAVAGLAATFRRWRRW